MVFKGIRDAFNMGSVTAILGPTNTGKTHLAIERMLGHKTGIMGLPLRLLAREVYDKISQKVGVEKVALITGEEKIKPESACYWVATVEAMPLDIVVDYLALDEVQLANDPERGHIFTDRILHARGRIETLFLGSQTMAGLLGDLIPKVNFISRPRLSQLSYASEKKITRLPAHTAIVAFSANDVYSIAELVRRQRGGAAVVLGALSPRTRNAQVSLFQNGDVDFLVATDAIGMGLNLNLNYVAFSSVRKFDGQNFRNLTPAELGQIAGRAGRHINNGLFGVTASCGPFSSELVEALETHTFDPIRAVQWRSRDLDFKSLSSLRSSLLSMPTHKGLIRARSAEDLIALENLSEDPEVRFLAESEAAIKRLWEVCQLPDYRKISNQNHSELIRRLYKDLMKPKGKIDEDWFARQVKICNRIDGDIDTLSNRLAHIRTWTFVSSRHDWLNDPQYWQRETHDIENMLSDALHERLTQRFVDRRTSVLMKGLRDKLHLKAEVKPDGSIYIEEHFVGKLKGFLFTPDSKSDNLTSKTTRTAVAQILSRELTSRSEKLVDSPDNTFQIGQKGRILWGEDEVACLESSMSALRPSVILLAEDALLETDRKKIITRLQNWLEQFILSKLQPLVQLSNAEDISGLTKGIAFSIVENYGALKREAFSGEIKSLDQNARSQLRKYGVRFGAYNIYIPDLLKPAAAQLLFLLWSVHNFKMLNFSNSQFPLPPRAGLTSLPTVSSLPENFYRVCGYHVCGTRAVRFDILERLSNIIRPLLNWKLNEQDGCIAPLGATGDGGFIITSEMISLLGCSNYELGQVLCALGFECEDQDAELKIIEAVQKKGNFNRNLISSERILPHLAPSEISSLLIKSSAADELSCEQNTKIKSQKKIIWRPRRRHQATVRRYKNFRRRPDTARALEKSNSQFNKKIPACDAQEKISRSMEGCEKQMHSKRSRQREGQVLPSIVEDRKCDMNQQNLQSSKPSLYKPQKMKDSESTSNSPFAALMSIRSKLVRSHRERGS